jgi:hypothetical protein
MADKKISQLTGATTPLAGTEVLPIVQGGSTVKVAVSDLTAGRAVTALSLTAGSTPVYGVTFPIAGSVGFPRQSAGPSYAFGFDHEAAAYGQMRLMSSTTSSNTLNKVILAFNQNGDVNLSAGNLIQGTAAKGINFTANTPAAGMTSQLLNWYEEGNWTPEVSGFGTVSYVTQFGKYTRIGNLVTITGKLHFTGASGSSAVSITGLPFTPAQTSDTQQRSCCFVEGDWVGCGTFISAYGMFRTNSSELQGVKNSSGSSVLATAADFGATVSFNFHMTYYV